MPYYIVTLVGSGLRCTLDAEQQRQKWNSFSFPPPGFFDSRLPSLPAPNCADELHDVFDSGNDALTDEERRAEQQERTHREREEELYDDLNKTKPISVEDGYVTFCRHFKYLGSFISFSLCADYDIKKRVTAATQSIGALKNVWDSPHLDIWSKYLLFRAIPMNLLLWGCETWSVRKALSNKLEVFLHRNIRRILRISMFRVKEEHLHNEHVRRMFYDIPRVGNMIAARQLDFLGKTMRGPHDCPAQQMMTACCDNIRSVGRPFLQNKDFIVKNLRLLFAYVPEVTIDDYGSLKNWINEALDKKYWNDLLDCLTDRQASIPERPTELPRPRRSPRNHDAPPPNQQPSPPTPPQTQRTRATEEPNSPEAPHSPPPHQSSPPRRQRPAPPPPQTDNGRDYDPEQVGRSLYDSLKILGLGFGASEREVKLAYRRLACIYHPDKWEQTQGTTGMTHAETTAHFQLLNNAQSFLRATL